jgi:NAD(P)-dependent dehydrogenase (short-subunit alcohol dehydrogenase family)
MGTTCCSVEARQETHLNRPASSLASRICGLTSHRDSVLAINHRSPSMMSTGSALAEANKKHIRGKIVLITGVSPGGLGAGFVKAIAPYGAKLLILAGRSAVKIKQTAAELRASHAGVATRGLLLDLASQEQVRQAAEEVLTYSEPIDVLVNNAGIMAVPYSTTADGIESQFGANHIGHFLFTNLIMPKIRESRGGGRIVNVTSDGYRLGPVRFSDLGFDGGKTYDRWAAYGQSKTANMLFSVELAARLGSKGVVSVSVHPGTVFTNLANNAALDIDEFIPDLRQKDQALGNPQGWGDINLVDIDSGSGTHVFAAFDPVLNEHNGAYCEEARALKPEEVRCWGRDPVEATRLWEVSEELVGQKFEH